MTAESPSWYIPGAGKQPIGPFTAEQIIQSWQAGKVSDKTLCWREGMGQWSPLSQVEPFATVMRSGRVSSQVSADAARHAASPKRSKAPLIAILAGAGVGLVAIVTVALLLTTGRGGPGRAGEVAPFDAPGGTTSRVSAGGASGQGDKASNYFSNSTMGIDSFDIPAILKSNAYRKFERVFRGGRTGCTLEEIEQWPLGESLSDVSRITAATGDDTFGNIFVIQLKRAVQPKEFVKKLVRGGDWAEQTTGGYTFFSNYLDPMKKVYFFPDDRTLVIGPLERKLREILDRKGPPDPASGASRVIRGVEFSHSATRANESGAYVPPLEQTILLMCGGSHLDLRLVISSLETSAVYIDVGRYLQVVANWTCRDEESAKKVLANMDDLLASAKSGRDTRPPNPSGVSFLPDTPGARELLDSIRVSGSGRTVIIKASLSEAFLDQAIERLGLSDQRNQPRQPEVSDLCIDAQKAMEAAVAAWEVDAGPKLGDQATEADLFGKVKYLPAWPVCPVGRAGRAGTTRIAIPPVASKAVCPNGIPSHARPKAAGE